LYFLDKNDKDVKTPYSVTRPLTDQMRNAGWSQKVTVPDGCVDIKALCKLKCFNTAILTTVLFKILVIAKGS